MHQSSQVFNLGRVSLTYTGPSQFNHINDKPQRTYQRQPKYMTRAAMVSNLTEQRLK